MNRPPNIDSPPDETPARDSGGHSSRGWLAMLACCIPMVLIVLLLVLR